MNDEELKSLLDLILSDNNDNFELAIQLMIGSKDERFKEILSNWKSNKWNLSKYDSFDMYEKSRKFINERLISIFFINGKIGYFHKFICFVLLKDKDKFWDNYSKWNISATKRKSNDGRNNNSRLHYRINNYKFSEYYVHVYLRHLK